MAASPGRSAGSKDGTRAHEHEHRQERHFAMNGRPGVEAVRQTPAANLRERERSARDPGRGRRDRSTGIRIPRLAASRRAPARRDRGGRRSARRGHRPSQRVAAARQPRGVWRGDNAPGLRRSIQGSRDRRCRRSTDPTCRRNRRPSAAGAGSALPPGPGSVRARPRTAPPSGAASSSRAIGRFELGERPARRGRRDDLKEAAELARALRRGHLGRNALFVDQTPVEPRRLAAGEHLGHAGRVRRRPRRRAPASATRR